VRAVPLLVLLAGLSSPAAVRADPGDRPRHNTSYVPDDDQETNAMVLAAREAAQAGRHRLPAERRQDLQDLGLLAAQRDLVDLRLCGDVVHGLP